MAQAEEPIPRRLEEGQKPVHMTAGPAEGKFGQSPVSAEIKKGQTGHGSAPIDWGKLLPIGGGGTVAVPPPQASAHPASSPPPAQEPPQKKE